MSAAPAAASSAGPSASASAPAASSAAASATDAGLVIDFAALLLGAVFPSDATAAAADAVGTDVPDERDTSDDDAPANSVDLLFSLLAPATPAPLPTPAHLAPALAQRSTPGDNDTSADGSALTALTAALAGQRGAAAALPQPTLPAPHTAAALPHTATLAGAAQATTASADATAALAALQLAAATHVAPDTLTDPLAAVTGTGTSTGTGIAGAIASGEAPAVSTAFASLLQTAPTTPTRTESPLAATATPDPATAVRAEPNALADAAAAKLSWQADNNIGRAELRISPQDLGTVDIELRIEDRKLHVDFTSPHAEVRDALEAGLPRLREQLASQGLTLAQADIGGHPRGDRPPSSGEGTRTARDTGDAAQDGTRSATVDIRHRKGLLDEYA